MGVLGMYLTISRVMQPRLSESFLRIPFEHNRLYALRYEYSSKVSISKEVKIIYFYIFFEVIKNYSDILKTIEAAFRYNR